MSDTQIIYALAVAGVMALRPGFVAWWLLANFLAVLAACWAMDVGALDRDGATLSIMIIDLATGAFLATRPGLPRIIAAAYVVMVPLYSLTIIWGVQSGTTFAIVNALGFIQLAVAGFGSGGDSGGDGNRGFDDLADHLATSFRIDPMGERGMAQDRRLLSANSRGLN